LHCSASVAESTLAQGQKWVTKEMNESPQAGAAALAAVQAVIESLHQAVPREVLIEALATAEERLLERGDRNEAAAILSSIRAGVAALSREPH
jgi:hypothetical protein